MLYDCRILGVKKWDRKKMKKYISRVVCCMIVGFTVLGNLIRKTTKIYFMSWMLYYCRIYRVKNFEMRDFFIVSFLTWDVMLFRHVKWDNANLILKLIMINYYKIKGWLKSRDSIHRPTVKQCDLAISNP